MNTDTPETDAAVEILHVDGYDAGCACMCEVGALEAPSDEQYVKADISRNLERQRNELRQMVRELRDTLQMINCIDLSPCNGGSCMVATDADDALDCIKAKAEQIITKATKLLQ